MKHRWIWKFFREIFCKVFEAKIECSNVICHAFLVAGAFLKGTGCTVNRRDIHDDKIPGPGIVELRTAGQNVGSRWILRKASYLVNKGLIRFGDVVVEIIILLCLSKNHIIDSEKYGEKAVCWTPWDCSFIAIGRYKFILNLLFEALYDFSIWGRCEKRVDCGSSKPKIIGLNVASIVSGSQEINEVWTIGRGAARIRGIPKRIPWAWLWSMDVVERTRIRVTAI